VGLEAQAALQNRAVELAVLGEDVARAAADFTADGDAAVAGAHAAAADDDVFHRHVDAAAVGVAAGLQRDAVVAGLEQAVFDQHAAARLGIAAVVIRSLRTDGHTAHGDVGGKRRM